MIARPAGRSLDDHHSLGDQPIPGVVLELARGAAPELVWRNELGGLTFWIDDRYVKWNPRRSGVDLDRERVRLEWISTRHPAPRVLSAGADETGQRLATTALPGEHAIGETWRARRSEAIRAIAAGAVRRLRDRPGPRPHPLLPPAMAHRVVIDRR